jgi:hypothetical protein
LLLRSFSKGGPEQIVAASFPNITGESETLRGQLEGANNLAPSVAISFQSSAVAELLAGFRHPILSVQTSLPETQFAGQLERWNPKAVEFDSGSEQLLRQLGALPDLEFASLPYRLRSANNDGVQPTPDGLRALMSAPKLRALDLRTGVDLESLDFLTPGRMLAALRIVHFRTSTTAGPGTKAPMRLPSLPMLQALNLPLDWPLEHNALKDSPELVQIDAGKWEPDFAPPRTLRGGVFNIEDRILPFAESGGLAHLTELTTRLDLDWKAMPNLKHLRLLSDTTEVRDLAKGPALESLRLGRAGQREIDRIATAQSLTGLQELELDGGPFDDLAPLAKLTKLRSLRISSWNGSPRKLDIAPLTALESLSIAAMQELEEVEGIATHPRLASLHITSCRSLSSLGTAGPNTALKYVDLQYLEALTSLDALHQTTGLKELRLYNCGGMKQPLVVDRTNPLEMLIITESGELENVETRKVRR